MTETPMAAQSVILEDIGSTTASCPTSTACTSGDLQLHKIQRSFGATGKAVITLSRPW